MVNEAVYNFRCLRETLTSPGLSFRTYSDTEVILHLFESLLNIRLHFNLIVALMAELAGSTVCTAFVGFDEADYFEASLNGLARDVLPEPTPRDRGYFRPRVVRSMLDLHAKGGRDYSTWIWTLFVLELRHLSFFDQSVTRRRIDERGRAPARVVR